MKKRLLLTLLTVFLAWTSAMAVDTYIKREVRGAWLATVYNIDWPTKTGNSYTIIKQQKNEMIEYLDILQAANLNAIYFQVRPMADALYQSSYEPWSSYLTGGRGVRSSLDALEFVVEECHARGMECHAWINPYRWATTATGWVTPQDLALKEAGLLISYTNSSGAVTTILNPALDETNERIVNVCREIIQNYDVDGIIFDDYFYPSGMPTNDTAEDYDHYRMCGTKLSFADWRRDNVNRMVKSVYDMIQQENPAIKFGISPAGAACTDASVAAGHGVEKCPVASDWQYNGIFSDPVAWLKAGTVDYISPQLYWKTDHKTNPFEPLTKWWSKIARQFGRHHYASHSLTFLQTDNSEESWREVGQQLQYSRTHTRNAAPGAIYYSACDIDGKKVSGFGDWLLAHKYQHPALTPAIDWKDAPEHGAVTGLTQTPTELTWDDMGERLRYTVYAIPQDKSHATVEQSTAGGILATYLLGAFYQPSFTIPEEYRQGHYFAVCILDRYGNEFEPTYTDDIMNDIIQPDEPEIHLTMHQWELQLNCTADHLQVVSLTGQTVLQAQSCSSLRLSGLPTGIYIVKVRAGNRSLTEKIFIR